MKEKGLLSAENVNERHEWRDLTQDEQQALDRWRERDADIVSVMKRKHKKSRALSPFYVSGPSSRANW